VYRHELCRSDWHATQLFLVCLVVGAYVASWSTDSVALIVRHHRLETFDKVRNAPRHVVLSDAACVPGPHSNAHRCPLVCSAG
jgi:hypothetical protein